MNENKGCVYLLGAGCGGAEWMTLRGLSLLQHCDAVVYDDLIDETLLAVLPAAAERHYMGKRCGKHAAPQGEISAFLIKKAQEGKRVVRLKGGDPFVFGRGGEEMLALKAAGIPCEEVPGISSAIAIPAAAGIPVTHRGLSQSFHVLTGHTADTMDGLPPELDALARLPGTLIILMGLSRLPQIAQRLLAAGKAESTPAAVVSGGNAAHPVAVRGTLGDIAEKARDVQSPAIIVVGAVAALDLSPSMERPLAGLRIGLTGTAAIADKLYGALTELGASAIPVAASLVEPLDTELDWDVLCNQDRDWLVFTSSNGVRVWMERLRQAGIDLRRLAAKRFAVIGAATGETLAQFGVYADLCPELYTSVGLGQALCQAVQPGERVLLLRSAQGSPELTKLLKEAAIPCKDISLYTISPNRVVSENSKAGLIDLDYLTFSSASGVELFFQAHGGIPSGAVCVCIGEVTARALERRDSRPYLLAEEISARGIATAILAHQQSLPGDTERK